MWRKVFFPSGAAALISDINRYIQYLMNYVENNVTHSYEATFKRKKRRNQEVNKGSRRRKEEA
jgi:hypothetical protein